jgi:trk system potassium uptake protein TrkA
MKQVCVIGLGQFGSHLARTLSKMDCEVLAIDLDEARVESIRNDVHRALIGDARNYQMLSRVLTHSVEEAVIALGEKNIEASILCALHLKKVGIKSIRSTATSDDHAQILRAVGATEITFPERDTAQEMARRIAYPDVKDMFSLAEDFRIMEISAPPSTFGKSLADLNLRAAYDMIILAIKEEGDAHFKFLPAASKTIRPKAVLMALGRELDLARFAGMD